MNIRSSSTLQALRDLAIMEKISLTRGTNQSPQVDQKSMVAKGSASMVPRIVPVLRDFPTLVSPLKMDNIAEENAQYQEPDEQQIRVSYSEPSLERSPSDGDLSDDEKAFQSAVMAGRHHQRLGNYKQALHQYRTALQCKNRTIDSEPQSIQEEFGNVLFDIANIHLAPGMEDRVKSMEAFHFCLDIRRNCLGSSHPDIAAVLYKLASIYSSLADHQYALELLLEAVSILLSSATADDSEHTMCLIQVWIAIGKVQEALGQKEEAESSFREAEQLKAK